MALAADGIKAVAERLRALKRTRDTLETKRDAIIQKSVQPLAWSLTLT